MDELLEHVKNTIIKNEMDDEIIILNVGGVKFETARSSLVAHPETTLGKLFDLKNAEPPKPIYPGGNEYFIDRNGHAFYYILEYYRTGEILWDDEISKSKEFPVTKRAIELEIEYFKIPINSEKRAARNLHQGVTVIDKFCEKLIPFINEAINRFISKVEVEYWQNGTCCLCRPFSNYKDGQWFEEFSKQGYAFLNHEKVVSTIEKRLKNYFPSIKVKTEYGSTGVLVVSDFFDFDTIVDSLE
ncbi:15357_t:CDS:2 [Cetraspora pellucida]|uniref:15357_t:CDS:1 n=1 Tax=Cetraspora pellucida TaxID=1433469 RepID=A0ACA9KZE5_9GLOM|nr:15357_t:CDS:2 [Cetraspora pellucida]